MGGQDYFETACEKLGKKHQEAIGLYGAHNEQRLTGKHETQSIRKFSFGVSDRGSSIRIPVVTVNNNWVGYLEDRRPASNSDPYKIMRHIVEALQND
jgi:glutamine synthetase